MTYRIARTTEMRNWIENSLVDFSLILENGIISFSFDDNKII